MAGMWAGRQKSWPKGQEREESERPLPALKVKEQGCDGLIVSFKNLYVEILTPGPNKVGPSFETGSWPMQLVKMRPHGVRMKAV